MVFEGTCIEFRQGESVVVRLVGWPHVTARSSTTTPIVVESLCVMGHTRTAYVNAGRGLHHQAEAHTVQNNSAEDGLDITIVYEDKVREVVIQCELRDEYGFTPVHVELHILSGDSGDRCKSFSVVASACMI